MSERYAFIEAEKANHKVARLCRVMKVSRSGFYAWLDHEPSARQMEDEQILVHMRRIHKDAHGRYGQRRMMAALVLEGVVIGRSRAARLMRKAGLRARRPRKFKATTDSKHGHLIADNVLARDFFTDAPDEAWVGDITYIWTREGWLYLAVLIDLFSRRVVGWSMGARINQELTLRALRMALCSRRPQAGLIHHTDRGSQYAANDYRDMLKGAEATVSMSRKGDCWDNAVSESFFATLKNELVHACDYATRHEATGDILRYLLWYNAHRLHSTLDYVSPNEFERQQLTGRQAA